MDSGLGLSTWQRNACPSILCITVRKISKRGREMGSGWNNFLNKDAKVCLGKSGTVRDSSQFLSLKKWFLRGIHQNDVQVLMCLLLKDLRHEITDAYRLSRHSDDSIYCWKAFPDDYLCFQAMFAVMCSYDIATSPTPRTSASTSVLSISHNEARYHTTFKLMVISQKICKKREMSP